MNLLNFNKFCRNIPADEMCAKYQRILSSNLLGYSRYVNDLPKDDLHEAKEENKQLILNTNKFWKFAKDESKSVSI